MGDIESAERRPQVALRYYRRAKRVSEGDLDLLLRLAEHWRWIGNSDEAVKVLGDPIASGWRSPHAIRAYLDAVADLETIPTRDRELSLELLPEVRSPNARGPALLPMARVLYRLERYSSTHDLLEGALEREPDDLSAIELMADTLHALGEYDRAESFYSRLVESSSELAE